MWAFTAYVRATALADAFNGVNSPNDALKVLEYAKSIASHNPEPHYYL
ncbi:hypothetical protein ACOBV8_20620 (plasmid) [Pseudoalteromonas espejiana]